MDEDEMTVEQLEEAIKAGGGAEETEEVESEKAPEPEEKTFEYTAVDGTVYKADSNEELFKKVTDALSSTKTALKDREHQIHEFKSKTEPKDEEPVKYDHSTYLQLLEKDGLKAQEYVKAFDPDVQALRKTIEEKSEVQALREETLKFYAETDYSQIETPETNTLIRQRLEEKGRSFTADHMSLSYLELLREGKLSPPANGKPVEKKSPMPSSASGSSGQSEPEPDFDNMSAKELAKYMKESGVPGAEYLQ